MEHKKEIFADGIGQIHFAGGMVRFDFVTLQPNENGAAPTPVVNERIIMPPQGFLGAFNSMQQLIDKLLEAGVLQKNEQAKQKPAAADRFAVLPECSGRAFFSVLESPESTTEKYFSSKRIIHQNP